MKRVVFYLGVGALLSGLALAETWNGTLSDVMCKDKDVANHTRKCALACAKSGYGLVLSDGKFVKFDESGNSQALAALKATSKEKELKATVDGTLDGEVIKVTSIQLH